MKFIDAEKYICILLSTEDGREYRTDQDGEVWERRYGESWESVYLEEEDKCKQAFYEYMWAKPL